MKTLLKSLSVVLVLALSTQGIFIPYTPPAYAAPKEYTADDIKKLMSKLNDPKISDLDKKRITAVIFVHQDVYRDAVIMGKPGIAAKDADVDAFLEHKKKLQADVLQRMNTNELNRTGKGLSGPIIPFSYNSILSDDDIILSSGKEGKKMEGLYNEALSEIVEERAKRPMTDADRVRIDVNGLAWDMTKEGAFDNYFHHEKYINPQSGFANQTKLMKGTMTVYSFDPETGRLISLPEAEGKAALERLATDRPLEIPGIEDMSRGTGAMSDYARMADMHQIRFDGPVVPRDVAQFIRNQKYTDRVFDDFDKIMKDTRPELRAEIQSFIDTSAKIRNLTDATEVAKVLQAEYKIQILDADGRIDWDKLKEAMKVHQTRQLNVVVPKLIGAVAQNEAFKILSWLEKDPPNSAKRRALRKQLAITYAPMTDGALKSIMADIDAIDAPEAEKAWLRGVLENDTRQIREYAKVLQVPIDELAARINMDGPSPRLVEYMEEANDGVRRLSVDLSGRPGGGKFREFLRTKTAAALNLDKMIDGSPGEKAFQWSVILLAVTRAYNASNSSEEGMKAMGMALFEMIPLVAATLRFSEGEFKESFKELAMDILPPLALAQIAVMALNYTAKTAIDGFTETVWDGLAREALKDFSKEDFEKSEAGYWRIKNREQYLEYLDEIESGLGEVQKLASMVEPEIDSRMSRDETVKNNEAALHTLQYLEKIDIAGIRVQYSQGFSVDDIKKRVWEKGDLAPGAVKNVERVAAKIILENMKIRAEIYTEVLESFIDRIENLYNEENQDEDFDASEVISQTQALLKQMYENAPDIIRNDAVAAAELGAEYRKWVEHLKDYDPKDANEMTVRRHCQGIIDDFKNFIRRLAITVRLRTEMENLNLRASIFGGEKSTVETSEVLLGDTFRIGASATIAASHGGDAWTLFYYVPSITGGWRLLGTATPRSAATGGGEGMFVLDSVAPATFVSVGQKLIEEEFSTEGEYPILPVIAFGGWSDPLNQIGLAALQSPMDYVDVFDENRVAFAGQETQVAIRRAKIMIKLPQVVYSDDQAVAEVYLDVPEYARTVVAEAPLKISAEGSGRAPKLDPERVEPLSTVAEHPSKVRILSEKETASGVYWIDISAKLKGYKDEAMPYPQKKSFEYTQEKKDASKQAEEALAALHGLLGKMKKLDSDSQEIVNRIQAAFDGWVASETSLNEAAQKADAEIEKLRRWISELSALVQKVTAAVTNLRASVEVVNKAGESAVEARTNCEKHVQGLCEAASKLAAGNLPEAKKSTLESLRDRKKLSFENQRERFRNNLNQATEASQAAEAETETLSLLAELEPQVSGSLENLDAMIGEAGTFLSQMKDQPKEAEDAVTTHSAIVTEAGAVQTQAASLYKVASSLPEAAGPWQEIQTLYAAIQGRQPTLENLAKELQKKSGNLDAAAAEWEKRQTGVRDEAAALLAQLPSPETITELQKTITDIKAGYDTIDLLTESIQTLEQQANQCSEGKVAPMTMPKPAAPQPQTQAANDSAYCGSSWQGRFVFDSVDRQGNPFPTEWFPPVDFTLWFDCGPSGMTGRIQETAFVDNRTVAVTAKVTNIQIEGSTVRFTKIYDTPGAMNETSEYTGEVNGGQFSGQWIAPKYSAHFTAKKK